MSEERIEYVQTSSRGEWLRFAILALVMLGAIVVVALVRPLIFDRIVPAIMGEGLQSAPVIQPVQVVPTEMVAPAETPLVETVEAVETTDAVETAEPTTEEAAAAPTESPPTATTVQHVVQPGENLTTIARSYNVTVQAIIAANNITNPNRINAGTVLLIPQP